ncbi:hypothetical protein FRX31_003744 [Thalictrum thalictroides]|uniref:Rna exonuclease n=1 Tax=Thalictrum thalictroides TaxID=46969 RepID=A0A7J6XCL0_THATH|nr:hypothetical protein FRX31_003744 [Thalictrum thalictroides]
MVSNDQLRKGAEFLMRSSLETARDELFDGLFDDFCYDKVDLIREYEEDMAACDDVEALQSEEDRKQVLEMGSLHIASQLFILRPWKLSIKAEFSDLKTIPIWVVMKKFPMELWDDEGFGRVTSTIGTPLFVDNLTESMTRTSYARVCVETDT